MTAESKETAVTTAFLSALTQGALSSGFLSPLTPAAGEGRVPLGLRRAGEDVESPFGSILLQRDSEGTLRWTSFEETLLPGRRSASDGVLTGKILSQFKFEKLLPSKVMDFLETLDTKLNPRRGLRVFTQNGLQPVEKASGQGRTLLVIHGTFSSADHYFEPPRAGERDTWWSFVRDARSRYAEVLSYDHPTLSVSPFLNAIELGRLIGAKPLDMDIICHSRGGLIARWWLEVLNTGQARQSRVVFAGSPLGGTSLAAPPRLRAALGFLTNVLWALSAASKAGSVAVPMFTAITGILRVLASLGTLGSRLPFLDAGLALVPGLSAQSRVGNNAELRALRENDVHGRYFSITSDFAPDTAQEWAFWRKFCLAKKGADLVFDCGNDLVVDTVSMSDLSDGRVIGDTLDFSTNSRVHHLNYFEQEETIAFLKEAFSL